MLPKHGEHVRHPSPLRPSDTGSSNLRVMGWVSKPQFSQCCCEKSLSRSCLPSAIRGKSLREVTPSLPANVRRLAGDCDVQVPVVVRILLRDVVVKTS